MSIDKNSDKSEMNLPPSPPVTVFLTAEELLSLGLLNFQTLFLSTFSEKITIFP